MFCYRCGCIGHQVNSSKKQPISKRDDGYEILQYGPFMRFGSGKKFIPTSGRAVSIGLLEIEDFTVFMGPNNQGSLGYKGNLVDRCCIPVRAGNELQKI